MACYGWLPVAIGGVGILATVVLWFFLKSRESRWAHLSTEVSLNAFVNQLESFVEGQSGLLEHMARQWGLSGGLPRQEWETEAQLYASRFSGVQALLYLDPSLRICWAVPSEDNAYDPGMSLKDDPSCKVALEAARDRHRPAVAPYPDRAPAVRGFLIAAPLFVGGRFDGFVCGLYRFDRLVRTIRERAAPLYAVDVAIGDEVLYAHQEPGSERALRWGRARLVQLGSVSLVVRLWPGAQVLAEHATAAPTIVLWVGSLWSLLLGATTHLATAARAKALALQASQERFALAVRGSADGVWDWNAQTKEMYYSPRFKQLIGYQDHELENTFQVFESRLHSEDREKTLAALKAHVFRRVPFDTEFRLKTKSGEYRWFRARGQAVWDASGRMIRMAGSVSDVTARNRTEYELRRLVRGIESAGEAIIITDTQGRVEYVNPAFTRLTGYTAAEALGRTPSILQSDKQPREFYTRMWQTVLTGEVWSGEVINRHKSGRLYVANLTVAPVQDDFGVLQGFVSLHNDITKARHAQEALERANAELQQKNQEMERFVYTISHDLKSPIVTILGYLSYLREEVSQGRVSEALNSAQRIQGAATRMRLTIDNLLDLSRIGRIHNEQRDVDVAELVRSLVNEMYPRFQEKAVQVRIQPDMPMVRADAVRLREVFENLLVNAINYGCSNPEPVIEVGGLVRDGEVRYFVRDYGAGVPKEYQDKVFGLFQRLDTSVPGTGVGLAIVRRVLEVHGGRCWIESPVDSPQVSQPGPGTAVWIAFPLAGQSAIRMVA